MGNGNIVSAAIPAGSALADWDDLKEVLKEEPNIGSSSNGGDANEKRKTADSGIDAGKSEKRDLGVELDEAIEAGSLERVKALVEKDKAPIVNGDITSALLVDKPQGNEIARYLIEKIDSLSNEIFPAALLKGWGYLNPGKDLGKVIDLLFEKGAPIDHEHTLPRALNYATGMDDFQPLKKLLEKGAAVTSDFCFELASKIVITNNDDDIGKVEKLEEFYKFMVDKGYIPNISGVNNAKEWASSFLRSGVTLSIDPMIVLTEIIGSEVRQGQRSRDVEVQIIGGFPVPMSEEPHVSNFRISGLRNLDMSGREQPHGNERGMDRQGWERSLGDNHMP